MYSIQLKGKHYQIGVDRGRLFQKENLSFPLHLDEFQRKYGEASEKKLREYFPEVCEEIRGVTDILKVDYLAFTSWLLCMGCCLYNLEQNIPVEVRGCTAFAYERGNRIIYGRNNDLPPYLHRSSKSELYQIEFESPCALQEGGVGTSSCVCSRFCMTTSSFLNGEEGLNEHGLAVAMTFVMTRLEQIRPGFNACFLVRYLLEKADCTQKAISLLMDLPIASNCNLLLADKSGEMVVVECAPSRKKFAMRKHLLMVESCVQSTALFQMKCNHMMLRMTRIMIQKNAIKLF